MKSLSKNLSIVFFKSKAYFSLQAKQAKKRFKNNDSLLEKNLQKSSF